MRQSLNKDLQVVLTVLFYMTTSISMVMLNKYVLNSNDTPLLLLWGQLIIAILLMHIMAAFNVVQIPHIRFQESKRLMPLIFVNAFGLSANTFCLQHVDASLYQVIYYIINFKVARSLTLPFTVFLSLIYLNAKISPSIIMTCVIIFVGFLSVFTSNS